MTVRKTIGAKRTAEQQVRDAWATLQNPAAFDALTAQQKAELLRRVSVWLVRRELKDITN